jgi:AmmeMemoRadiSam system protein B
MPEPLPRLRLDLEFTPSPVEEHPGVFIRDPYRYTESAIIVPPLLAEGLAFFDGQQTDLDLQAHLARRTGQLVPSDVVRGFIDALSAQGFLQTEAFAQIKKDKIRAFADGSERMPIHAGTAYPADRDGLEQQLEEYSRDGAGTGASAEAALPGAANSGELVGLAAPHVSPEGGWRSYASAYRQLGAGEAEKTFIILGTSHYGVPEKFGLTRKPFVTPLGTLETDQRIVKQLSAQGGDAVLKEDYCHSIEHSIEFQCVFLQHRLGSGIKIVPILCGPFADSLINGNPPETDENVRRFFDALREIDEKYGSRVVWVLGIDLAHIGRRYGDDFQARSEEGHMVAVGESDKQRLERVCNGDPEGFFELVRPGHDQLRWCGYSPVYTFLQAVPSARGRVLRNEQWNIDEMSVVSFAGVEFRR